MCTVSFVPINNGYILTSNRDEDPKRPTKLPNKLKLENDVTIFAPLDVLKGGSWIAMDRNGRSACLLNGAFIKHISKKNYRKSRGQIVFDAFKAENFEVYAAHILLDDIEPFTLILIESNSLIEVIWDGAKRHIRKLSKKTPLLWSSSTLYSREEHMEKEAYFMKSLQNVEGTKDHILEIHGSEEYTPFRLQHPFLQTVSICQLQSNKEESSITYIIKNSKNQTSNSVSVSCD